MKTIWKTCYVISVLCLLAAVYARTRPNIEGTAGYLWLAGALFAFTIGRVLHQNNR